MNVSKPYLSLGDFLSDENKDADFLISGVLPKVGLVVMLGAYGTGKTQLAMRMAASVATGSIFGHGNAPLKDVNFDFCFPRKTGYTLYFAGEGKAYINDRVKATKQALKEEDRTALVRSYGGILPIIPVYINSPLRSDGHIQEIGQPPI